MDVRASEIDPTGFGFGGLLAARTLHGPRPVRIDFDRGTLLLSGAPPWLRLGDLPGTRWDPRVRQYRAPACFYSQLRDCLGRAKVSISDRAHQPEELGGRFSTIHLRSYQSAALAAWRAAGERGLVALPTGSGKTCVALGLLAKKQCPSLILVPTRVLAQQWQGALQKVYDGEVGCFSDGARTCRAITISTYASAERHLPRIGNRFDLVVIDEAHHIASQRGEDILAMTTAPGLLGLSATPPSDPEARSRLEALLGSVVYELSVADLSGRYLAPCEFKTMLLDLSIGERENYEREMRVFRRVYSEFRSHSPFATWSAFCRAANRSEEGRRAVASWRRARRLLSYTEAKARVVGKLLRRHRAQPVLIFTRDNESAYAIAKEHLVMPITCDIRRAERTRALECFRAGQLRALVSARVLNEGYDLPSAEVAVVVAGSLGRREHLQRVGRLLRPAGDKRALVYELVTRDTAEVRQWRERSVRFDPERSASL